MGEKRWATVEATLLFETRSSHRKKSWINSPLALFFNLWNPWDPSECGWRQISPSWVFIENVSRDTWVCPSLSHMWAQWRSTLPARSDRSFSDGSSHHWSRRPILSHRQGQSMTFLTAPTWNDLSGTQGPWPQNFSYISSPNLAGGLFITYRAEYQHDLCREAILPQTIKTPIISHLASFSAYI